VPSALQWLTSPTKTLPRIFDVFGPDATLRTDVVMEIERRVSASERVALSAAEVSDDEIWRVVSTSPLAGVVSRLVVVSYADRIKKWHGLTHFIKNKAAYTETTLLFLSERAEAGVRQRSTKKGLPGKPLWETVLTEWEEAIRSYAGGCAISCTTPSIELPSTGNRGGVGAQSSLAKWLSLRLEVTQQQAEYLWSRAGEQSSLARDVVDQLRLSGIPTARFMGVTEFRAAVDVVLTAHGSEDFAELVLFGRKQLALTSLADHTFTSADWMRIIGYLSQRLDWLAPLNVALLTNERLDQVQRRLGIHRKYILHYAHREDPAHNIAKHYDRVRVLRCRRLLADLDACLAAVPGVPPAFGEVLLASW
jgi:hypothetical protein